MVVLPAPAGPVTATRPSLPAIAAAATNCAESSWPHSPPACFRSSVGRRERPGVAIRSSRCRFGRHEDLDVRGGVGPASEVDRLAQRSCGDVVDHLIEVGTRGDDSTA